MPSSFPRLGHQPALDGVRAIAVIAVLLFHGGVDWAAGGFLGVDVFFVMSGFLITWLLVSEWDDRGRISIGAFYARRARRLFPALVVVLVAVAVWAAVFAPTDQAAQLRGDFLSTITYLSNWHLIAQDRAYFDSFSAPSPLAHTWSLAVEEQWYLVWPLVMVVVLRLGRRRGGLVPALSITALLLVGSAVLTGALYEPGTDPSRVYYGTDTRAQELLAGALLALVMVALRTRVVPHQMRRAVEVGGVMAVGALVWMMATVDGATSWLYEGGLLVVSAATLLVIVAAIQPDGMVRRALSLRPLQAVGLISYGLYLWHFPVYVVATSTRTGLEGAALLAVRIAVTTACALASHLLIEQPVRRGRIGARISVPAGAIGLAGAGLAVWAIAVPAGSPVPSTMEAVQDAIVSAEGRAPSLVPPTSLGGAPAAPPERVESDSVLGALDTMLEYDPARTPPPVVPAGETSTKVLLVGDSVAQTIAYGHVQGGGDPAHVLWDRSMIGCSLLPGERIQSDGPTDGGPDCGKWRRDRINWPEAFEADVVVLGAWIWELHDRIVDGETLDFGEPETDAWFIDQMNRVLDEVSPGGRVPVAILTAPCNARPEGIDGTRPVENDAERVDHLNDLYRQIAASRPEATILDLNRFVCPDGEYLESRDGVRLRSDGVHFSYEGAAIVRAWLYPRTARVG